MAPHRIDVHHHIIPDAYLRAMDRAGLDDPIKGVAYPRWDVDTDLAVMDQYGIRVAVVSITAPGLSFASGEEASYVARATNEAMAQLCADHPERYGAFALIPLPDVDAALREIDFALDVLGLDGVGLFTNHQGTYLGDPQFEPVLAALAERDALVHVHPAQPAGTDQPTFGLPPSLYEFTFDTSRMVANLLYSGTLDRYPGLRMILSHAGGAVPFLAHRMTYASTINPKLKDRQPDDVLGSLRNLYYDTAMSANRPTLAALTSFVGTDRILFGSDYPFMPESTTAETVAGLRDFFAPETLMDVEWNNAAALLPRFASLAV
ncbi:amidohydrolase [Streptomyces sp. NBC_00882]|uniref:amidohydrolase family protein n=1 Tax=Streptomyces TaxID=1883 RepID=UPI00386A2B02|nr:amidohydrolase [Streptomyces sp. NBC_00882]WSZ56256.1 amidohydrolase [Streptomyces canus]